MLSLNSIEFTTFLEIVLGEEKPIRPDGLTLDGLSFSFTMGEAIWINYSGLEYTNKLLIKINGTAVTMTMFKNDHVPKMISPDAAQDIKSIFDSLNNVTYENPAEVIFKKRDSIRDRQLEVAFNERLSYLAIQNYPVNKIYEGATILNGWVVESIDSSTNECELTRTDLPDNVNNYRSLPFTLLHKLALDPGTKIIYRDKTFGLRKGEVTKEADDKCILMVEDSKDGPCRVQPSQILGVTRWPSQPMKKSSGIVV